MTIARQKKQAQKKQKKGKKRKKTASSSNHNNNQMQKKQKHDNKDGGEQKDPNEINEVFLNNLFGTEPTAMPDDQAPATPTKKDKDEKDSDTTQRAT